MNIEHERALFLEGRASSLALIEASKVPHRTHGILLRITLFLLTLAGVGFFYWFLDEIEMKPEGVITGVIAIGVAEFLILRQRWWWTGVEEALWIGATYALISELPSKGTPESLLVLAAAAAIPGARVRNPLFGALAAGFVAQYFEKRFDLGVVAALVIALIAVFGLLRTWRRPSNEFLCIVIAIALPVAGYANADAVWRNATIALFAAYGTVAFFLAIRYRHHALFLAGGIGIAIASIEVGRALNMIAMEVRLAIGGALLLAGSWIASRLLRDRKSGIVTTPAKLTAYDDELEIAATLALPKPEFESQEAPETRSGGGRFGGAGATGDY